MKRIRLLLAVFAAMVGLSVNAQQEPVSGTSYYVYNVETGKFLSRGNEWGTQAVTNDFGLPWQVTISDGKYTLRPYDLVATGNNSGLGANGYSDNGSPIAFTPSGDATGYTLTNGTNVLVSPATYGNNVLATSGNSTWQFLNVTEYKAVLEAKTAAQESAVASAANIDITGTTLAAVVGNSDNYTATDMSSYVPFPSNSSWTRKGVNNRNGNANQGTYGIERYEGGGTESYTVTGLVAGVYKVGVRAMFRSTTNAGCSTIGDAGYVNSSAYFSANGKMVQIKDWYSSRRGNEDPNSTGAFVEIANGGGYYAEVYTYVGEDGVLDLKAVSESYLGASWFLFNGVTLTYYLDNSTTIVLPESITLSQTSASLTTGSSLTLNATVSPDDALDKTLSWTSSDETVATVTDGIITAVKAGSATITATANGAESVKATCTITVADATVPYYSEIAEGDFFIQNAATGKFLSGGNDWGTHASIIEHGTVFTAAKISDGVYTLDSHIYNKQLEHFVGGAYVDGAATNLYITALGNGKYSISTADGSNYMTAFIGNTYVDVTAADASNTLAQWYFVSKTDRDKAMTAATANNPVDATYYIKNPQFSRNQSTQWNDASWTMEAGNKNLSGGADNNRCAESYHSDFTLSQTLTVPNGTYRFRAQGFYRQDGSDNEHLPVFYANNETVTFPYLTGSENSMSAASASFLQGAYHSEWGEVTVTDRTLTIGAKLEGNTSLWCIFDNFELELVSYTANTGLSASIDKNEIQIGQTANISAETVPATASFNAITSYASSDESIATVDADGVVTGVGVGSATITVTANEMENFSTTVDVTVKLVTPTSFELSETEVALDVENPSATLTITTTPEGANDAATWVSSDETVATVVNGVVTGVSSGTATITATSVVDAEVSAQATVTVAFPESAAPEEYYVNNGAARTLYTIGENLFKNGTFEYPNAVAGWKTIGYTTDAVEGDFTINATGGVNGGAYITTNGGGAGSKTTIRKAIAVEVGKTYYFSVYTSGKAPASQNLQYNALFKMSDATTETGTIKQFEWPQGANNTTSEWSKTECVFTAETPYVGVRMGWNSSSSFDEFVLVKLTEDAVVGNAKYALDAIPTANIGENAFQYSQAAIDAANALVQGEATVEDVENAYAALTTVNAPADGQLFNVILTYAGYAYDNKAMTYLANGRTDGGLYNIQYKEAANKNLAQAFTFTKVEGSNYKMSQIDADGVARYISTGVPYNGNTSQIRTTTNADQALVVTVIPTATEGVWNLKNTEANQYIGSQDAGVYTVNSHIDFQIVETTKPSITINTTVAGYGTTMLPFAVAELPEGVKVYTCDDTIGDLLTLTEADAIEANKPYIIAGAWEDVLTGDAQGKDLTTTEGLLIGVYADTAAPVGSFVLQNNNDKVGFYFVVEEKQPTVGANHAYLTEEAGARAAYFFGEGVTNGINAIEALTEGNVGIFNAAGVQQPRLQKGLNIVKKADGTSFKVMVK